MIVPGINPHRFRFASPLEATLAVEFDGAPVGNEQVLMKSLIATHQPPHELRANAPPLIFRQDEQMGIVNDEVTVGNRVPQTNKLPAVPCRDERVRSAKGFKQ